MNSTRRAVPLIGSEGEMTGGNIRVHPIMSLSYSCPDCGTTMDVHEMQCEFEGTSIYDIEKAYIDIISPLTRKPLTKHDIIAKTNETGEWSQLHHEILKRLNGECRIEEIGTMEQEGGEWPVFKLLTPEEYREKREVPDDPNLTTIYEEGPVRGCRDNALVAMIAYYAEVGMSWEKTQELIMEWLEMHDWHHGWDGERAENIIAKKQHVYEKEYNWGGHAKEAAKTIRNSQ